MLLSVVISTYNRSDVLKQNLDHFKNQTDMEFEIVVGIDGSTDDTIQMLNSYQGPFSLRWINTGETEKYCLAKVRNMAIVETVGQAVVILDDDSFPTPEFIAAHKSSAQRGVITGGYRNSHDPKDSLHPKMKRTLLKYGINKLNPITERIVENNACMMRSDLIGCGMFSERFEGYGGCGTRFSKVCVATWKFDDT